MEPYEWHEGRQAFENGILRRNCPFRDALAKKKWQEGWDYAERKEGEREGK